MDDPVGRLRREEVEAALFGTSTLFAPIRHHSPACAWHLRAMMRAHRPEVVLIEAPEDLLGHLPHLTDPETRMPVAIVALGQEGGSGVRPLRFLPFSEHAPETIAVQEAARLGAEVRFIDLPSNARLSGAKVKTSLQAFQTEAPFEQADFIRETCARLGLRDGAELWDHLFETRLGQDGWAGFFVDVYAYCAALRATTSRGMIEADDTLPREAAMRAHLTRITGRRAVVVTGGFHTPALLDPATPGQIPPAAPVESYLVGYGEEALDALSGYAAGLRYPGWYARLWSAALAANGPPDWEVLALETAHGFARAQAGQGRPIALPQLVEMLGVASGLAHMKGRAAVMLPDLFDGMRSALIKGEAGAGEPWSEGLHNHLRGARLGVAPRAAGQPPLVGDARRRAAAGRFDLSDSIKRSRKLDFRRKESHAEASRFCHQMGILDTGFAALVGGPDLVSGVHAGLLFEEWDVAWSPFVEGRLIEASRLGSTLADAATARLLERRQELVEAGRGGDLGSLLTLLLTGLRAGLGVRLPSLALELAEAVGGSGDMAALAEVMRRLHSAGTPGDALYDPASPDLVALVRAAYDRLLYLCEDLAGLSEEAIGPGIEALGMVAAVLRGSHGEHLSADRFDRALAAVADRPDCPPLLLGGVLGLISQAGMCSPERVAQALKGGLGGVGLAPEARAAVLDGVLRSAPSLLWQSPEVLRAAEEALAALDDDAFLLMLPALRRSLTQLNPHETDRLASELGSLIGSSGEALTSLSRHKEADLARGLEVDQVLGRLLAADGLDDWGAP